MKQVTGNSFVVLVALGALGLSACGASVAPKELMSARDAVADAESGPAKALAPVQLEEAKQALAQADNAFSEGEDDQRIRDLSYIAERKAEIAQSRGKRAALNRDLEDTAKAGEDLKTQVLESKNKALKKTQAELDREQRESQMTKAQLEKEREARLAVEKKLSAALKSLDQIAQVKEEKRGVVITLSGSVLFATGKHELLPIAKDRLNEVAKAVKDQGFKSIVVEGHTDSRGSDSANEQLSLKRAEQVRAHLITQGIPSDKITAVGRGESSPVADNSTPEGRANNRRVELVVTPE